MTITLASDSTYSTWAPMEQPQLGTTYLETIFDGRIQVRKAANGYVLCVLTSHSGSTDTYVAKDLQELNELITSVMVKFRLDR